MKNKFLKIFTISALTAGAFLMTSCNEDETLVRKGKPGMTISENGTTTTITEGEDIVITFNLDYALKDATQVRVEFNGEGVTYDDFNATNMQSAGGGYYGGEGLYITIPAFVDTYTYNLSTVEDFISEADETATLTFYSAAKAFATIDQEMKVTLNNFVGEDLIMRLDWDGDYIADACGDLDFDLELLDGGFNYIGTSYTDCPESLTILGTDPDDSYTLDVSLWESFYTGSETGAIPASVTFAKAGVFNETYDLSSLYNLADGGNQNGNANAYNSFTIVKTGTTYTITDPNANPVVSGKAANYRMSVAEKRALKNK